MPDVGLTYVASEKSCRSAREREVIAALKGRIRFSNLVSDHWRIRRSSLRKEREFLESQPAQIATASRAGEPDVAPVGFEFDGECFYVGGLDVQKTLKYKNALTNPRAAIVFDDLQSTDPWTAGVSR